MMDKKQTPHWLAPTSMMGALVGGVAMAGGHHLFYAHLEGNIASASTTLWDSVSVQEANIAIGTAFAFLVKSSLVFAMSIAFAQLFWREARNAIDAPTLAHLDSTYSAFYNILSLCSVPVWLKYPLLIMVAALAWIIPIASIITPATLTIQNAAVKPFDVVTRQVPNLDFRSMNFLAAMPHMGDYVDTPTMGEYLYNGPSQPLLEISNAVLSGGQILPINPPAPNSSWELQIRGPSVKCDSVSDSVHQRIRNNIAEAIHDNQMALYGYLSWFANSGFWGEKILDDVPFTSEAINGSLRFNSGLLATPLYIVASPQMFSIKQPALFKAYNQWKGNTPDWVDGTMLQCRLYNTTYHVSFSYVEGNQEISISMLDGQTDEVVRPQSTMLGPNPHNMRNIGCQTGNLTADQAPDCYSNPQMLRTLSYQAILDAFASNLVGDMYVNSEQQLQRGSSIMNTVLLQTPELSFLRTKAASNTFGNETMQSFIEAINDKYTQGLINQDSTTSSQPLGSAIEEMFRNYTVSLMSSSILQPNASSITAPPPTQVTMPAYRNIYVYSAVKLWAAYGVAILLATLAVLMGMVALLLNGASYSHNFSTVFRVARGAQMSENIRQKDTKGEDPLPKYLADARIRLDGKPTKDEKDVVRYRARPKGDR